MRGKRFTRLGALLPAIGIAALLAIPGTGHARSGTQVPPRATPDIQHLCIRGSHLTRCIYIHGDGQRDTLENISGQHAACFTWQEFVSGRVTINPPVPWPRRVQRLNRQFASQPYGDLYIVSCNPFLGGGVAPSVWHKGYLIEGKRGDHGNVFVHPDKRGYVTVTGSTTAGKAEYICEAKRKVHGHLFITENSKEGAGCQWAVFGRRQ